MDIQLSNQLATLAADHIRARGSEAKPQDGAAIGIAMPDAFVAYLLRGDINDKSDVEMTGISDTR